MPRQLYARESGYPLIRLFLLFLFLRPLPFIYHLPVTPASTRAPRARLTLLYQRRRDFRFLRIRDQGVVRIIDYHLCPFWFQTCERAKATINGTLEICLADRLPALFFTARTRYYHRNSDSRSLFDSMIEAGRRDLENTSRSHSWNTGAQPCYRPASSQNMSTLAPIFFGSVFTLTGGVDLMEEVYMQIHCYANEINQAEYSSSAIFIQFNHAVSVLHRIGGLGSVP